MASAALSLLTLLTVLGAAEKAPPVKGPHGLEQLAEKVAGQIAHSKPEAPVGVYVEAATGAMTQSFTVALASALTARKLAGKAVTAGSAADAETLARKKDFRSLATVTLALSGTTLTAQANVISTWVNFWSGASPSSVSGKVLSAQVDADMAVLALAAVQTPARAALVLEEGVLTRLPQVPAAIAAFDIDADKRAEVAVLMEDALWLLTPDGKPLATYDLRTLPRAANPSREPFGAVAFISNPVRVVFLSGKYAEGQCLALVGNQLRPTAAVKQVSLDGLFVSLKPGSNDFAADVFFGKPAAGAFTPLSATSSRGPLTFFAFADGSGQVVRGIGSPSHFRGVGSGSALLDIDGDGQFEVLASSARHFPAVEELRLFSASAAEALGPKRASLWDSPALWQGTAAKGRVLVAAGGDLDGDGAEEGLLGIWLDDGTGELHFLKRSAR